MGKDTCCEKYKKKGKCCKGCPLNASEAGSDDAPKKKDKKDKKDKKRKKNKKKK
ncbi:MAG: hypothetical protein ACK5PS_19160 [Desulfopila sp.]